ncbi:hypothetical protein AB0N09_30755 [Streptomyces erythrochromogenes]|uniref:hypothetical protein n=1 Tax=Streptomyces erythrochromogenes TaxID=285574 RepID=UPI00344764BE
MLTDKKVPVGQALAPFLVQEACPDQVRGLEALIWAHQRACPDEEECWDSHCLDDRMGMRQADCSSGVWVMADSRDRRPLAAMYLDFALTADGMGLLHVRHLLSDPERADESPEKLMATWAAHYAAHRPAAVREVHVHSMCPLALALRPSPAVQRREQLVSHGRRRLVETRLPQRVPSLTALVATGPDIVDGQPYEVLPIRSGDCAALVHCLQEAGVTGRAEDYPTGGARGSSRGRIVMGHGGLAAAFTLRTKATGVPGSWPAEDKPALHLEQLRLLDPGCDLGLLVWLTGWAARQGHDQGLSVVRMAVTQRGLAGQLGDLGWRNTRVRATPGGLAWLLELHTPQAGRDRDAGGVTR